MTGWEVACRQTASVLSDAWLLMVALSGSEVDQSPRMSGIMGQLPSTEEESENCTSLPGAATLWSAVALGGLMAVVILQGWLMAKSGGVIKRYRITTAIGRLSMLARLALVSQQQLEGMGGKKTLFLMIGRRCTRKEDYTANELVPASFGLTAVEPW